MKLMTLNIWGGYVHKPLLQFINRNKDIDIFCLQEVYYKAPHKISTDDRELSLDIFSELHSLLPQHNAFFRPVVDGIFGIGMFVKKDIQILEEGEVEIYNNPEYEGRGPKHHRNLQWIKCKTNNKEFCVINVHGLWNGQGKTDTEERINQSQKIKNFVNNISDPKILCGDFNLRPDTKSLEMISANMRDLIQEYEITSTRSSLYTKPEKFADYIFTSKDIIVRDFKVLPDEVSDHLSLVLDFSI